MNETKLNIITTGIEGLDRVLGGGIPRGSLIMLVGAPGTGKTILIQQLCYNWAVRQHQAINAHLEAGTDQPQQARRVNRKARQGGISKAIYFSTLSEPHDKLLEHIREFEFFNEQYLLDHIRLLSLTGAMEEGLQKVGDLIIDTVRHENAGLIAIDGFRALEGIAPDIDVIRRFLYRLSAQLNLLGATAIISLERTLQDNASEGDLTIADGIIGMYSRLEGAREFNRLEVRKMRGMERLRGMHTYRISRQGIMVYPRMETVIQPELNFAGSRSREKRLGLGLPELEEMLGGGLPRTSLTLVVGSPGVGKTILSLHYLLEGVRQGERGLFISFEQSQTELVESAVNFGLDLQGAIDSGLLHFIGLAPVELEPDIMAALLTDRIEQLGIERLVVDNLVELERACQYENRAFDFMAALAAYLKKNRVTALFNYNISKLAGRDIDLGRTAIAILAENLILLRRLEYGSRFYRVLSILQMRSSEHEWASREFTIDEQRGIHLLSALEAADTGSQAARLDLILEQK